MIIRGGFKGPDDYVTVSVSPHDILTFPSWITRTAATVRKWEISCRACITAARRVHTGHLALSLEKLQAHPGRGPSNNAWKENTHVCLYKSITKGKRGFGQVFVCKAQPLELELLLLDHWPQWFTQRRLSGCDVCTAFIVMKSSMHHAGLYSKADNVSRPRDERGWQLHVHGWATY